MSRISYKRRRFLRAVILHAVWLYFRFTLSFREVEEMLAQRGERSPARRCSARRSSSARRSPPPSLTLSSCSNESRSDPCVPWRFSLHEEVLSIKLETSVSTVDVPGAGNGGVISK